MMREKIKTKKRSKKSGLAPGTLVHIGHKRDSDVNVSLIGFDEAEFSEKANVKTDDCAKLKDAHKVTWLNVDGVHRTDVVEAIGKCFKVHPLVLEDIVNTTQRPKVEDFEDYMYAVVKMIYFDPEKDETDYEQVSVVFGKGFVISFQERPGDVFEPIRERIRTGKGRVRKAGADYLAYALIDAIVDNYFSVLEKIGDRIEDIESELMEKPTPDTLQAIHNLKREMIVLRKSVWPLRELISFLEKSESELIDVSTKLYLRDVYDHTIQAIDTIENYRDMVSGMLDIYLSSTSNRMNEIMKVLTVIATIFIPLTFIAGVYGMNFDFMPELHWRSGYFLVWGVMIATAGLLVAFFRKKKWI